MRRNISSAYSRAGVARAHESQRARVQIERALKKPEKRNLPERAQWRGAIEQLTGNEASQMRPRMLGFLRPEPLRTPRPLRDALPILLLCALLFASCDRLTIASDDEKLTLKATPTIEVVDANGQVIQPEFVGPLQIAPTPTPRAKGRK